MLVEYQANFVVTNNLNLLSQNGTGSYIGDLHTFFYLFSFHVFQQWIFYTLTFLAGHQLMVLGTSWWSWGRQDFLGYIKYEMNQKWKTICVFSNPPSDSSEHPNESLYSGKVILEIIHHGAKEGIITGNNRNRRGFYHWQVSSVTTVMKVLNWV